MRLLRISSDMDQEYFAAVKRKDLRSLQSMIEDQAHKKGFNIGPVYHGTNSSFRIFKLQFGKALWFSEDKEKILRGDSGAVGTSKILTCFIQVNKPAGWKEYDQLMEVQMISQGFDSIKLDEDWVVFYPNHIKLADLVTKSSGKIIPLSQRFDSSKKDIRF